MVNWYIILLNKGININGDDYVSYDINVNWDEQAGVWYAICDEIPLATESDSFESLIKRTKIIAREMLEINGKLKDADSLRFITSHQESIA